MSKHDRALEGYPLGLLRAIHQDLTRSRRPRPDEKFERWWTEARLEALERALAKDSPQPRRRRRRTRISS